jgi:hypothetical protein
VAEQLPIQAVGQVCVVGPKQTFKGEGFQTKQEAITMPAKKKPAKKAAKKAKK